jgi:hypothetical protein
MRNVKYFVLARDLSRNLAGMTPIDAKTTQAEIHLQPGLSISGTVQDANHAPITDANVNVIIIMARNGGMVDRHPVKVGEDGTFVVTALPIHQQYSLNVTASGYGSASKNFAKTQTDTNSIQVAPFHLRVANRELAGQVLNKDGKPVSGAWVNIWGNNQPNGNIQSDSHGRFKFEVCDGPITINANAQTGGPNNFGSAQSRGGDTNVIVKLGVQENQQQEARENLFKPQPWTLSALIAWPSAHKTATMALLSMQVIVLLGTAGAVLLAIRKRKE